MRWILILSFLGCIGMSACKSPQSQDLNSQLPSDASLYNFCSMNSLNPDPDSRQLWSAETVQSQLDSLLNEPYMGKVPWAAYAVAYKEMTAARDRARCGGVLSSEDPFMNMMNHELSDIMTRWYVNNQRLCPSFDPKIPGFCALRKRIQDENLDALSATMASTGIYLSSHLALSLSAIAYDDNFWAVSPHFDTYRSPERSWKELRESRIRWIKRFKLTYDRFNGFLADNIPTVAAALTDAGLVKCDTLNLVSGLSRFVPLKAKLFASFRDEAFEKALAIIETIEPQDHPMITVVDGGSRLDYGKLRESPQVRVLLQSLEDHALTGLAGPSSLVVYRHLLGGKTWDELIKNDGLRQQIELP